MSLILTQYYYSDIEYIIIWITFSSSRLRSFSFAFSCNHATYSSKTALEIVSSPIALKEEKLTKGIMINIAETKNGVLQKRAPI